MKNKKLVKEGLNTVVKLLASLTIAYLAMCLVLNERHLNHWDTHVKPALLILSALVYYFLSKKSCVPPTRFLEKKRP